LAASQSCGDELKQPNEACDCGALNGQYAFNGIRATAACSTTVANAHSCSWDCQAPGPRCGDNIINGPETCDGGFQEFKGICNNFAKTGCDTTAACPDLGTCVDIDPASPVEGGDDHIDLRCSSDTAKYDECRLREGLWQLLSDAGTA
jgi:hypothetical protein